MSGVPLKKQVVTGQVTVQRIISGRYRSGDGNLGARAGGKRQRTAQAHERKRTRRGIEQQSQVYDDGG